MSAKKSSGMQGAVNKVQSEAKKGRRRAQQESRTADQES